MPFDEDLRDFFHVGEHGTAGLIGGVAVAGIFDDGYSEVLGSSSSEPTYLLAEIDARAGSGDLISVSSRPYRVRGREPDGTGLVTLVLEEERTGAGNGLGLSLNQPFYISSATASEVLADHSIIGPLSDGLYHKMGIYSSDRDIYPNGSPFFTHLHSDNFRDWTFSAGVFLGSWSTSWRKQVWAPHLILNPLYGVSGTLQAYKWLMFFTGVNELNAGINTEQKIGLYAAADDAAVIAGTWSIVGPAGVGDDNPIYWTGMATAGYPLGAPWCNTATYESDWGGASRDPFVITDGSNYYMLLTCKQAGDVTGQQVGLAKFAGGMTPDFTNLEHMALPLYTIAETSNVLHCEAASIYLVDGRWHFLYGHASRGTVHQSSGNGFFGDPWDTDEAAGTTINDSGGYDMAANEITPFPALSGDKRIVSGHKSEAAQFWYAYNLLDFDNLVADDDGLIPTQTNLAGITGLRARIADAHDEDFRVNFAGTAAEGHAFFYQPVVGDEPLAAGGSASGMDGNSYINTAFRRCDPGKTAGVAATTTWSGWVYTDAWTITKIRATFKIAGDRDAARQFVALVRSSDNQILHIATGQGSHTLRTVTWDLSALIGESVRLVMADLADATNPKTYGLSFDAFQELTPADGAAEASTLLPPILADNVTLESLLEAADADVQAVPWS